MVFLSLKKIFTLKIKNFFFGKGFKILADILINSKDDLIVKDLIIKFKRRHGNRSKMNFRILIILIRFYIESIFKKMQFFS